MAEFEGKKIVAGEVAQKAASDNTVYNSMDVALGLAEGIGEELRKCAHAHVTKFDMEEFFVVFLIAKDPMLTNLMRRKFYAWPHLPKPRPNQSVFLYNKVKDTFKRLWVLPNALTMAELSCMTSVAPHYQSMKRWSDAFYDLKFHELIREENGFEHLSEEEYLDRHREELIKAGLKEKPSGFTDTFDFHKVVSDQISNSENVIFPKDSLNLTGKAKASDGNITP